MRTFILLMYITVCSFTPKNSFSQVKVIINANKEASIDQVFKLIKEQTDLHFIYQEDMFKNLPLVHLEKGEILVSKLLEQVLSGKGFDFDLTDSKIIKIKKKELLLVKNKMAEIKISGEVTDSKGFPVFAAIEVKGTPDNVVFADENGKYTITVPGEESVLIFSSFGYENQEVVVKNSRVINISLKESINKLDEVQITAYGKTSKRLATGNITTITAEDIQKNPVSNVLEAVQGRVPGVYIRQLSGQPGSPIEIQMRGKNTLTGSSSPLIVIDGVTYPYGDLPEIGTNFNFGGGNALNYIDPNTIETINFLKDADATAIYGSRGSNGVILITTKKGRVGKPIFSFTSKNGVSFRGKSPNLLNTADYVNYRKEAIANAGLTPGLSDVDVNGTWSDTKQTDWTKYFLGGAAITRANTVSYSGGSELVNYLMSANYNSEENIQNANGKNTIAGLHFNLNASTENRKFSIGLTGTYTATQNTVVPFNSAVILMAPNAPSVYNADGTLNWEDYSNGGADTGGNPGRIFKLIQKNKIDNLVSSLNLKYTPIEGLDFNTDIGVNILSSNQLLATPTTYYQPGSFETNSSNINNYRIRNLTIEPNVSYDINFKKFGNVTLKTGATLQDALNTTSNILGVNLLSDDFLNNPTMADRANITDSYSEFTNRYIGFFGILNYNFFNKYILNASIRHDGSTKFASGNRFGTFGSIGASWIISEEEWFVKHVNFISFAKLRSSYGTTGGDGIGNYKYITTYGSNFSYNNNLSYVPSGPSNPYLHWENNKKAEVSISLSFFKDRISLSHSYYWTKSNDQLIPSPTSIVTGVPAITKKSPAVIKNWGHEITLSTENIKTNSFKWSTDFNITLAKNELVSYPNVEVLPDSNYEVGKPITGVKLYNFQGVNTQTGNYNFWKDQNRNGVVDGGEVNEWSDNLDYNKDRTVFINLAPKYYGGIQNNFGYKNLNLGVFLSFTVKKGQNFLGSQVDAPGIPNLNITQEVYDARWQKPGDVTNVARITTDFNSFTSHNSFINSSGAISNASFARIENINLSYDFSRELLKKLNIHTFQLYIQGQNLFVFSKYKGYDPESLGVSSLAPLRTVVFGVNLTL
ncbi:MAG: SusC/RagA family TonB-linked outer membrane protein [Flavobacterium sp.]